MQYFLVVLNGPVCGHTFPLADFADFTLDAGQVQVCSFSEIYLNGLLVADRSPRVLSLDDVVQVGRTRLRLSAGVSIDPTWLGAAERRVERMARHISDGQDYTVLPVLADALEEAGCTSHEMLAHCRRPDHPPHGCWVIDNLLGRTPMPVQATDGSSRPRRLAIVGDIHGNLEALNAVLADIDHQQVEAIYCLGDVVGYGPNPRECLDLAMRMHVVLLGNFEQALMFDTDGFSPVAERSVFWGRQQLEVAREDAEIRQGRWEFLATRPRSFREGNRLFVHGSPRNPLNEYVFPEDIYNQRKMERIYSLMEGSCFKGHTHIPGIFIEETPSELYQFHSPEEIDYVWHLDARKTMIEVGSVGQPRDGDWRACYVVLDGETVHFRRVEYNIETTVRKIYDIPELENFLGDRLRDGR